jgi:general secretion pathway protein D
MSIYLSFSRQLAAFSRPRALCAAGSVRAIALGLMLALLGGCSTLGKDSMPQPLRAPRSEQASDDTLVAAVGGGRARPRVEPGVGVVAQSPVPQRAAEPAEIRVPDIARTRPVALAMDGVPIDAFINVLYGMELGFPVQIDATVRNKRELLSLNLTKPRPPADAFQIGAEVLRSYGVKIHELGGVLRFQSNDVQAGSSDVALIATRSLPEVPAGQRVVFVAMPLEVAQPGAIAAQVRSLFASQSVTLTEMVELNALMISGPGDAVRAAMGAVTALDRSALRGMRSIRINPSYLSAELLAKELKDVLAGQGVSVRTGPGTNGPLTFVPVASANALIVFSESEVAMKLAQEWAERLDQPNDSGDSGGLYMYAARHTTVETLAPVLQALVGGVSGSTGGAQGQGAGSAASGGASAPASSAGSRQVTAISGAGGNLAVDPVRNVIVFQGDAQRWRSIQNILTRLDVPARQVLIEVTVAEVTLTDEFSHGVEWALRNINAGGMSGPIKALAGGSTPAGALTWTALSSSGQVSAALNLFAKDGRVTILSTPRVLVKSGEVASIDVGTEVPIITSQATAPDLPNSGLTPSVLQSIQYRKTGTLLQIEPVVHSGKRVDLKVSQEVSEAAQTESSEIASPSIFSRKLETSLSLADGQGTLLGGLISSTRSDGKTKVPLLGDIPLLGRAFQNRTRSGTRTELLMLITPYVLEDAEQARAITDAVRSSFDSRGAWPGQPLAPHSPAAVKGGGGIEPAAAGAEEEVATGTASG